jgi:hypothetical protein
VPSLTFSLWQTRAGIHQKIGKSEGFLEILNYVLDWDYHKLQGFLALYLSVFKEPFRKLSAFVGVTRETFCCCIPLMAGRAGNFRIVTHSNHE